MSDVEPSWFEALAPAIAIVSLIGNVFLGAIVFRQRWLMHEDRKNFDTEQIRAKEWKAAARPVLNKLGAQLSQIRTTVIVRIPVEEFTPLVDELHGNSSALKRLREVAKNYEQAIENAEIMFAAPTGYGPPAELYADSEREKIAKAIMALRDFLLAPDKSAEE